MLKYEMSQYSSERQLIVLSQLGSKFEYGKAAYDLNEQPQEGTNTRTKRWICCRDVRNGKVVWRLKDRPPGVPNPIWVSDFLEEEDLELA